MTELEEKIQIAANAYYNDGSSNLTDEEFDALMNELRETQPDSPLLKDGVQEELKGVTKKYKLAHTMGTLAKCMEENSIIEKWNSVCKGKTVIVELKIDGGSCLLHYENGELVQALSRGDTEYGEDLTANIRMIKDIPSHIEKFTGYIRGEYFLKRSVFNKYFSKMMKNPRNTAAGIIKRKDGENCDKLSFIAYDLWDGIYDNTEKSKLHFLETAGFVVPTYTINPSLESVLDWRNKLNVSDDEIPCDGLVIKQNIVNQEDLQRKTPMYNFAIKPETTVKISKLKRIDWQLAGSYLAPVAIIEPVELCGTTVEKASLANINIMNELGVYEDANVFVKKSGEIIPQIIRVETPKKNSFTVPTVCPICGGKIKVNPSGIPECINKDCPRKVTHRFAKMFEILGIKGAGEAFLNSMEERRISVLDFIEIVKRKDTNLLNDFAGSINGEKILIQFDKAMSTPISTAKFLALFDYGGFDEKKCKLIKKSLDEIYKLTFEELIKIDGFAEITANSFLKFISSHHDEIEEMRGYFKIMDEGEKSGKLNGLSFCFTGAACLPRSKLQALVEENGGINKSGVSKGLSYLVTDDTESGSSKNKKAKELGIPVISSNEFIKMLD